LDFKVRGDIMLDMSISCLAKPLWVEHAGRPYSMATAQGMSGHSCIKALTPTYAR